MNDNDGNVYNDGENETTAGTDALPSDPAKGESSGGPGSSPSSASAESDFEKGWAPAASAEDIAEIEITPGADAPQAAPAKPSEAPNESPSESASEDSG